MQSASEHHSPASINDNQAFQEAVQKFLTSKHNIETLVKQSKTDRETRSRTTEYLTKLMEQSKVNYIQVATAPCQYLVLVDKPSSPPLNQEFLQNAFLCFFKNNPNVAVTMASPSSADMIAKVATAFSECAASLRKQLTVTKKHLVLTDKKPLSAFLREGSSSSY